MSIKTLAPADLRNIKRGGIMDASLQKDNEIGVSNGAVKSCLSHNGDCSFFTSSAPFLVARTRGDESHRRCSIGTPTSIRAAAPIGVGEGSNKTVTGALQMSSSFDARARLNIRVAPCQGGHIPGGTELDSIRPFPRLFLAIADAFCNHLTDGGDSAAKEIFRFDMQVFSLCIAGGLDQHNWYEMTDAQNYIYQQLGHGMNMDRPPEQPTLKDEKALKAERPGLVYILRNASIPNLVKIGFTCQRLETRVRQLSQSTSVPTDFEVVSSFKSNTPNADEQLIHLLLSAKRATGSEFFAVTESEAITACKNIIGEAA